MFYGYARVSTLQQANTGNSLEYQEKELIAAGATNIYKDSYTGKSMDRPELELLLNVLNTGDTLIVTKLDRVARSLIEGSKLVNELIKKGIRVHILNIGLMDNTPSSKLIRNIFFAFAEFERDMIIERTQEGKSIAKLNPNYTEGRPNKFNKEKIEQSLKLLSVNGGRLSYKEVSKLTGISEATLYRKQREYKK